ncbi:MAG: glucosamine-6-phosphate isomerase [Actinomycetota bacterium]
MNLITTIGGSMLEGFFPAGWDLAKIDALISDNPADLAKREPWWHPEFQPVACRSLEDFEVFLGHEMAREIQQAGQAGQQLAMILPVGPMGMYRWVVYFLQEWGVDCSHVHGFNMDEWSDSTGRTLPSNDPAAFQNAMEGAFYGPLGSRTVPASQRNFAVPELLPTYAEKIAAIKADGGRLVTVFGVGRVCHIAFWEPHFAGEFQTEAEWRAQTHRLGARLHPLTIEQNAITSFKSRTTLVPAFANTVGPGLFLNSDRIIGGCDGTLGRGMMWQGLSLWMTLHHEPSTWIPSSYMPTLPGRLFYLDELAGPLVAECN